MLMGVPSKSEKFHYLPTHVFPLPPFCTFKVSSVEHCQGDLASPSIVSLPHLDEWFLMLGIDQSMFEVKAFYFPCTFLFMIPSTKKVEFGGVLWWL